jgi:hypothetical protein
MRSQEKNKGGLYHLLCANLPIALYIIRSERTCRRGNCLGKAEICVLQKRELEFAILTDDH